MKKILLSGYLILSTLFVFAQNYGNEWINFSQNYYKIKIAQEGVYRISQSALTSAGIPIAGLDPRNIHLYKNGEEQYIYIKGESDGTFDLNDYIDFYGQKNDGKPDSLLYEQKSYIPHDYYSLFTDTSFYYLTWDNSPGRRITQQSGTSLSGSPEPYYIEDSRVLLTESYHRGEPTADRAYRSDYNDGEGWFSDLIGKNSNRVILVPSSDYYNLGPNPSAEILAFGASNDKSLNINHHLQIKVGATSTNINTTYLDSTFKGYTRINPTKTINSSDIGNSQTYFRFSIIDDLGAAADNNNIAYISLKYPRTFDLNNTSSRRLNFTGSGTNSRLRFTNFSKTNPIIYDFTNNLRITGLLASGNFEVMVPNAGTDKRLFVVDETDPSPVVLEQVTFTNLNPQGSNYEFIIITHEKLLTGANAYANYRSSMQGGGHNTLIITSQQLYDQFYFGLHHPLATRNFVKYLLGEQATKPKFLFLLGKGYNPQSIREPNPIENRFTRDLVPTFGLPGSDNMLMFGLDTNAIFGPAIPVGRVSARNNQEIQIYLDKIMAYESAPKAAWNKRVMQVTGANDLGEKALFRAYIDDFANNMIGPKIGAIINSYEKDDTQPVSSDPKELVIDNVNEGLFLYNYFGHGSAVLVAVDVGDANEYNNTGRYPIMFFNGCSVGNCFAENSIGENFLLTPNKGAISFLANSNLGYISQLKKYADLFIENLAEKHYGEPIGIMTHEASRNYQGVSFIDITQMQQITLQGDPAMVPYNSPTADYVIENSNIFLNPSDVTALSDSFQVIAIVENIGRASNDSVEVQLIRTLPNNSKVTFFQKIGPIYNRDTVYFTIISPDIKTRGFNKFEVSADPNNKIVELNEMNNTGILDFFMPANSVNNLLPIDFGIVSTTVTELVFQNNNLFAGSQTYKYEIDTSYKFDSPWKNGGTINTDEALIKVNVNLLNQDSTVYYWRAKIDIPASQGGVWENSSFTYFGGSPNGWNQSDFGQYLSINPNEIIIDTLNENFRFVPDRQLITARITRFINPSVKFQNIRRDLEIIGGGPCGTGVRLAILDEKSLNTVGSICSDMATYGFDVKVASERQDFQNLLRNMKVGNYIVMQTIFEGAEFLKLDSLPYYLSQVGADTNMLRAINHPNYAYVLIGRKGYTSAWAAQDTAFSAGSGVLDTIPAFAEKELEGIWYKGTLTSPKIGPASKWVEFSQRFFKPALAENDTVILEIIGVDKNDKDSVLMSNLQNNSYSLSSIDPNIFPFLKIKAYLKDTVERSISQLSRWTVLYDGIPEGTIVIDQDFDFQSDTLNEGDTLKIALKYENISNYTLGDSILVHYSLIDNNRNESLLKAEKMSPLAPGQDLDLNFAFRTNGLVGENTFKVFVNPAFAQPELYLFNNVILKDFNLNKDPFNPVLDVTFDGRHIFDGDIVSPNPNVLITIKDENILIKDADTTNFVIKLKRPGELVFNRIYFGTGDLELVPASNEKKAQSLFKPNSLPDGDYEISVEVTDKNGNPSGVVPYVIGFKVINEAMISNVYPYPNPFSTKMRFVFTLTGSEIPDRFKVQIYTVSGKLVREVTKEEMGPIYIGNNISEFTWDGTDQFGDRLANGVYFYKVNVSHNGQRLKKSTTEFDQNGDKYFKNNIGKIYLLR